MSQPSLRFDSIAPGAPPRPRDVVVRLKAYVPGEQPTDPKITKLNTNEFPYAPAPEVIEAVRREAGGTLRLYPHPTSAPLRQALAGELGFDASQVMIANGSDEALRMLFQAYVAPGDEIACPYPTYSFYPVLADMYEGRLTWHETGADGALADSLFEARPRMFVVANPDPPMGTLYSAGELARLAEKRDALLIIDEAYVAFAERDCLELVRRHPNAVAVRTFSKSHALAGMRIGYVVAHPDVIAALDKIRDPLNVTRASQAAALAAVGAREYYEEKARRIVADRERLRAELIGLGFTVPPSQGNFLFARGKDGRALMESLRKQGILVRFFDHAGLRDGARITIGTTEEVDGLIGALRGGQ